MRVVIGAALLGATFFVVSSAQTRSPVVRFVFTSDAHYGLTRSTFRGHNGVSAHEVNSALVSDVNSLGEALGPFDFVAEGGDVANRAEIDDRVQAPASSWAQFKADYIDGLTLHTKIGARTPV